MFQLTDEQLLKYWEENPGTLEQAIAAQPGKFAAPLIQSTWDDTTDQLARAAAKYRYSGGEDLATHREGSGPKIDLQANVVDPLLSELGDNIFDPSTGGFIDIGADYIVGRKPDGTYYNAKGGKGDPGDHIFYVGTEGAGQNTGGVAPINRAYVMEDNKKKTAINAAAIAGLVAGPALGAAMGASGSSAAALGAGTIRAGAGLATGESLEEAAKAGLLSGGSQYLTGVLGETELLNPILQAPNVGGAAARGATTELINQAVQGDFDLGDLAKAGLIQGGIETIGDVWMDARQTHDGHLIPGVDTIDGRVMTGEDVERLTNTSDLYGLLGEGGLLDKMGLDVGYAPTKWIGATADFLGFGRPVIGHEAAFEAYQEEVAGIREDLDSGALTGMEAFEAQQAAKDRYNQVTSRYDEREFILNRPRGDSPLAGIYEYSNQGTSGPFVPGGSTGGGQGGTAPGIDPVRTPIPELTAGDNQAHLEDTTLTPITDAAFAEYMSQPLLADVNYDGSYPIANYPTAPTAELAPVAPPVEQVGSSFPTQEVTEAELLNIAPDLLGDVEFVGDTLTAPFPTQEGSEELPGGDFEYQHEIPESELVEFENINTEIPEITDETTTPLPEGDPTDPIPPGGDVLPEMGGGTIIPGQDIDELPSTEEKPDETGPGGGGFRRFQKKKPNSKDHLNRMARIVRVAGLPAAQADRLWDITANVDPETTEYIIRQLEEKYEKEKRQDPIQEAIDDVSRAS